MKAAKQRLTGSAERQRDAKKYGQTRPAHLPWKPFDIEPLPTDNAAFRAVQRVWWRLNKKHQLRETLR